MHASNHARRFVLAGLSLVIALGGAAAALAELRLPHIFSDHMVLQCDKPIRVWGWADPWTKVVVAIGEQQGVGRSGEDGRWNVEVPAMPPGGPYTMNVTAERTIAFNDVLIGEVWVCSGQSNMEMGLKNTRDGKKAAEAADHPRIRYAQVPWKTAGTPQDDAEFSWKVCTPENVVTGGMWGAGISAVGYYFACELERELKVPVGIVQTTWGGTRIEPWIPTRGYELAPGFDAEVKRIEEATPKHNAATRKALADFETWLSSAKKAAESDGPLPPPPAWPQHELDNNHEPTGLFNAMVQPIVPLTIRGVLWYQGESNRGDGMKYLSKMNALITGWRELFNQGEFPFFYVQLAPYRYDDERGPLALPEIWEAQTAALTLPNVGMAETVDIGDLADIHPKNKLDVAKRLARWALSKTYGRPDIVVSGPLYKAMKVEGDSIRVMFEYAEHGLVSRDGKPLTCFQIAGADHKFVDAEATIDGDAVVVRAAAVKAPTAVRFAWHQEAEPNLSNKDGLPASPFRTDR